MYTKQTWKNGDVITEEKLNHMEDGIANAGGVAVDVTYNGSVATLTKTWEEINEYAESGATIYLRDDSHENIALVIAVGHGEWFYVNAFVEGLEPVSYVTDTTNGHPTVSNGGEIVS